MKWLLVVVSVLTISVQTGRSTPNGFSWVNRAPSIPPSNQIVYNRKLLLVAGLSFTINMRIIHALWSKSPLSRVESHPFKIMQFQ